MGTETQFDVIVVGGGHAGTEAAHACARMGAHTLLLTHSIETLGQMSCNPSIGGIGKSHLVKEIDAMGGLMAKAADRAGIHFRILNAKKGPAVRATRAQADRVLYKQAIRQYLESQPSLVIFQQPVDDLLIEGNRVLGVKTQMGLCFMAKSVVLTVGTFLAGLIHIGDKQYAGGRAADPPASALAKRLRELPLHVGRLKTGTPPRIDGRSIDYTHLTLQPGDEPTPVFSYTGSVEEHPQQLPCHITHTNEQTHDIIRKNLHRSPMYSGAIHGIGPRYCPSIEDKIVRFSGKTSHQLFIEPEGLNTHEVYPNGISTSLPYDVQYAFVRSIKGFENAHITRPGYAIEYDYFDPMDLKNSLETKSISGLFFAGQINGTTGYEEAAAQGLVAGINAVQYLRGQASWCPRRDEAYIGVLIDDLITKGTQEPYRMFTARAEFRLLLREDNADLRLTEIGRTLGLVADAQWKAFSDKRESLEREKARLQALAVRPNTELGEAISRALPKPLTQEVSVYALLSRPEVSYVQLMSMAGLRGGSIDPVVALQVEIQAKYSGYIERQETEIKKMIKHELQTLSLDMDYGGVQGLSSEIREKLTRIKPTTIGMASRISGVTPAAISLLLVHLKKSRELA